jgi:hypothetical protein
MPSKTPPISVRLGAERLSRLDTFAAEHKLSRHLALLTLLDEGHRSLTRAKEPPKIPPKPKAATAEPKPRAFVSRLKGEWKAP